MAGTRARAKTKTKTTDRTMRRSKQTSLSIKISLMSALILLVVFISYAYLSCLDSISEINNQYRERALSLITAVDASINDKADLSSKAHIQGSFDELKRIDKKILKISLYVKQSDGRVIRAVSSAHDEIGAPADDFDAQPIKTGETVWEEQTQKEEQAEEENEFKADHIVEILAPIVVDGKRQASLGVYMNLDPKDIEVAGYIKRAVFYAIFALFLQAALLYLVIRRELFAPLRYLSDGVKEVAIGNLDRKIDLCRNDELGELSREFDHMTDALLQREEENKELLRSLKEKWVEAEEKSHIDYLTELENHRSFQDRFDSEINLAARTKANLSIAFCDLDNFKGFNDINGHQLGDKALFEVADIIRDSVRDYDLAARYGGEEFAIILPQTDSEEASAVAERIRANVEEHLFTTRFGLGYLTISIGVATYPYDAIDKESMIAAADSAMYASKYAGRNKVSIFSSTKRNPKKAL